MPTSYPNVRESLNPSFANVSDSRIESVLQSRDIDAEAMEGFFDDLGKFASGAAKVAAQVAPSVLPIAGTVLGTVVGGPAGAALGGTLGSLAGKAIGAATGQAGPGPALSTAPQIPVVGGAGSPAAGQLLQTLFKPQTVQALTSMALGSLGRPNVQVGDTPVPLTAFTNLLSTLAGRAESEYNASMASAQTNVPGYMRDYAGLPKGDPAVAQHRAEALYELLESSESEQEGAEAAEAAEAEAYESESEMESLQAEYDAIEMAELYEFETEEA
jgi:hypothetical protein